MGAALRLPRAGADGLRLPRLPARRRRGPAPRAGLPPSGAVDPRGDRARPETGEDTDRPSIYAAVMPARRRRQAAGAAQVDARRAERAIEHETLAHAAAPVLFAAFQHEPFYREVQPRYARIARCADAATVFADFPAGAPPGRTRRPRSRSRRRRARQRVGRHRRRARLRRLPPGLGAARRDASPATPTTSTAASRRSGRSTRSRPAARARRGAPGGAGGPGARRASCGSCSTTGRWRSRSRRRR